MNWWTLLRLLLLLVLAYFVLWLASILPAPFHIEADVSIYGAFVLLAFLYWLLQFIIDLLIWITRGNK